MWDSAIPWGGDPTVLRTSQHQAHSQALQVGGGPFQEVISIQTSGPGLCQHSG